MAAQEMILKLLFNDEGTFVGLEEINKELKKVDDSTTKVEETTKGLKQQYASSPHTSPPMNSDSSCPSDSPPNFFFTYSKTSG